MNTKAITHLQKKLLSSRDELDFVRSFAPDELMPCSMEAKERAANVAALGIMTVGIAHFFPEMVGREELEIIAAGASLMELLVPR